MNRILVIRGGAIGDFILTLPAVQLLRANFPPARIEILGHKQIIALAENRIHADAIRSIDDIPLSRFFVHDSELPTDLMEYFAGFDLIVSYLFDPDRIFAQNLKRCGVGRIIAVCPKFNEVKPAARQLARPLAELGFDCDLTEPIVYLKEADSYATKKFLGSAHSRVIAIHPGSGSKSKNWPLENWMALGEHFLSIRTSPITLVVIGGEADENQTTALRSVWSETDVRFAINWPLPQLAALLRNALFLGHDSGISHLAAAAGAQCILLFGPTDPAIWAPTNERVRIIRARGKNLTRLGLATVRDAVNFGVSPIVRSSVVDG
jgi:heptosyltransferase III